MRPAVVAAVLAAVVAGAALGDRGLRSTPRVVTAPRASPGSRLSAGCPRGTLPDDGVCIPVPTPESPRLALAADAERIPRLPNRDADYARYAFPVANPVVTVSDARDIVTDGGPLLDGLFVQAPLGAPVTAVTLDGQQGPTLAVYAGAYVGDTVVSYHAVRVAERRREYLVVIGHLANAVSLASRAELAQGAVLGNVGAVPLYLDARLVRAGTDVWSLPPKQLLDDANSISVDVRNVLGHR